MTHLPHIHTNKTNLSGPCSISIMVVKADTAFIMHTIPHLIRSCRFDFLEKVLFIDKGAIFSQRQKRGTLKELRNCCRRLLSARVVDRVVDIDYTEAQRKILYKKHFGCYFKQRQLITPYIHGIIFSLESVKGDYIVHFDSDMLMYQKQGYSWISEGIRVLESCPHIMFVNPRPGPPGKNGKLKQRGVKYILDKRRMIYLFKIFTSRHFLLNRARFENILPIKPSIFNKIMATRWEELISYRLAQTDYWRADLASPYAWSLHPCDHGPLFIKSLPKIIARIESGYYPEEQGGDYDLQLDLWT